MPLDRRSNLQRVATVPFPAVEELLDLGVEQRLALDLEHGSAHGVHIERLRFDHVALEPPAAGIAGHLPARRIALAASEHTVQARREPEQVIEMIRQRLVDVAHVHELRRDRLAVQIAALLEQHKPRVVRRAQAPKRKLGVARGVLADPLEQPAQRRQLARADAARRS